MRLATRPVSGRRGRLLLAGALLAFLPGFVPAQQQMDELVVTGRQPGPPLWRVSNGERQLWILPLVSTVPRDMIWEDGRVGSIIDAADEAIGSPDISVTVSKLIMLNPVNVIRGIRLFRRISTNPDGATLEQVLPAPTYARFAAMKAKYFPKNKQIENQRPAFATGTIASAVLREEGLTDSGVIARRVEKLIRRARDIRYTEIEVEEKLEGNFKELSRRIEAQMDSLAGDREIACFEVQLTRFERHVDDMRTAANAWATGSARDMEDFSTTFSLDDPCVELILGSSEGALVEELVTASTQLWLDAAANALESNASTFSMLPMEYIVGDLSLMDRLAAMGYTVHKPN